MPTTHKRATSKRPASLFSQSATPPSSPQTVAPAHPILRLQSLIGNRAVGRLIQAKLTVNPVGDQYEQEADRVAKQAVQQMPAPQSPSLGQTQPSSDGIAAAPDVEATIHQARGSGQAIPAPIRARLEQSLGADFRGVRVHTDARADHLNRSLQARAFTTGQDIFFRHGEYNPGGSSGREVLAHELTHVIQQSGDVCPSPREDADVSSPHRFPESDRVQRLVLQIDQDEATQGSYKHLTTIEPGYMDPTGSLRAIDTSIGGLPLEQLGVKESLHVIIHNVVGEDFALVDGAELFRTLVAKGLTTDKTGTIRLISCESGTEFKTDSGATTTVARQLKQTLEKNGFANPVIGFKGLVRAGQGAAIYVIPSAKREEFWRLKRLKGLAEEKALGGLELDDESVTNKYLETVEKIEKKIADLWERQSPSTIEYLP